MLIIRPIYLAIIISTSFGSSTTAIYIKAVYTGATFTRLSWPWKSPHNWKRTAPPSETTTLNLYTYSHILTSLPFYLKFLFFKFHINKIFDRISCDLDLLKIIFNNYNIFIMYICNWNLHCNNNQTSFFRVERISLGFLTRRRAVNVTGGKNNVFSLINTNLVVAVCETHGDQYKWL